MTYLYLDTETLGLDLTKHPIWEIAYAVDDFPVLSGLVEHYAVGADPEAVALNGYRKRFHPSLVKPQFEHDLRVYLAHKKMIGDPVTLVGANPAFDAYRLSRRWDGTMLWRYRLIDVESMALPIFGWDIPYGLADISAACRDAGYEIPQPDHTAASDVEAVRAVHKALTEMGRREQMFAEESV